MLCRRCISSRCFSSSIFRLRATMSALRSSRSARSCASLRSLSSASSALFAPSSRFFSACCWLSSLTTCACFRCLSSLSASAASLRRRSASASRRCPSLFSETLARSTCKRLCRCLFLSRCSAILCRRTAISPSAFCRSSRRPWCCRSMARRSRRHPRKAAAWRCAAYFRASQLASWACSCSRARWGNSSARRSRSRSRPLPWNCRLMQAKRKCASSFQPARFLRSSVSSCSSWASSPLTASLRCLSSPS
mmetsp:Transcript_3134/g.9182  ORF Transcript_3134/g.9182 Transcript_3134/m.9182 type:complete len:250 (+) Transcript_3134:271-1020(+)